MKGLVRLLSVPIACGVLGAAAFAACGAAAGSEDSSENTIITNVWTKEEKCTADMAVDVTFADVATHPERFDDQCVRISGMWYGRALYSDVEGYHRVAAPIGTLPKSLAPYRIGIYGKDEVLKRGEDADASLATLLGRIGRCENLQGGSLMVMGYCHYSYGAYIALASVAELRPIKLLRQTGDEVRRRIGNLEPLSLEWPRRHLLETIAARWMNDIRKADIADFAELLEIVRPDTELEDEDGLLYAVFSAPRSPFATFRGRRNTPEPVFFRVIPPPVDEDDEPPPEDESQSVACFCREASCEGRWPISKTDASNHVKRPYVCLSVLSERTRDDGPLEDHVQTDLDYRSLEEPPRAKPRR
jgi:hypothetical protein